MDVDAPIIDPVYMSRKIRKFERINSIRETNGNFDSCNSCKRLGTSRLHELHESKFPFVSRIEFIRSKLSNFSAHVYGVTDCGIAGIGLNVAYMKIGCRVSYNLTEAILVEERICWQIQLRHLSNELTAACWTIVKYSIIQRTTKWLNCRCAARY